MSVVFLCVMHMCVGFRVLFCVCVMYMLAVLCFCTGCSGKIVFFSRKFSKVCDLSFANRSDCTLRALARMSYPPALSGWGAVNLEKTQFFLNSLYVNVCL